MKLYIGIVRTVSAILLMGVLLTGTAMAMPLPTTPPEVDSTPASHEPEPEGFREAKSIAQPLPPTPSPLPEPTLQPVNRSAGEQEELPLNGGLDTGSVLLIGGVIWYAVIMIGITGGRRGTGRHRQGEKV